MKTLKKLLSVTIIAGALLTGVFYASNVLAITALPDVQSFYRSTLTSTISSSATTINVATAPNVTTGLLVVEPRTTNQEIVYMTGRTGTALTVVRGLAPYGSDLTASTSNRAHSAGVGIEMADVHYYVKTLQDILKGSTSTPSGLIVGGDLSASGTSTFATTTSASSTITNLFSSKAVFTEATSTYAYISSIIQALSAIITTLTTDALTVNTSASLPATTFNGTPTWNTTPSNASDLANKGYVDSVAIAGAASSTETVTGIVRLATKAQASLGTSADAVNNRYVLPASMATSTSQVATTSVVVTNTSGKIDPTFLASSTSFSITGTSTAWIGAFPAYNIGKNIQVITTTGTSTFSVPSGINKIKVSVLAGGGDGGTSASCGNPGASVAGGGGGGGFSEKYVDVTGTSSIQVFVGAKNQWSTFGTNGYYLYANPGLNGSANTGGVPGSGNGGDINITGGYGDDGITFSTGASSYFVFGAKGGNSMLGFGGNGAKSTGSVKGIGGTGYGSGGGGGVCYGSVGQVNPGNGAQGIIIISW